MEIKDNLVECFRLDGESNILNLGVQLEEPYKLYHLKENQPETVEKLVDVSLEPNLVFPNNSNPLKRSYFGLQQEDENIVVFGERILPIQGMFNFRDIGGYPTSEGKRIKWGKIYRGDHLFTLESSSQPYVENLKITTVMDLRSPAEIIEFPNKKIGPNVQTINLDPDAPTAELSAQLMDGTNKRSKTDNETTAAISRNEMIQQQIRFVNEPKSKAVFSTLIKHVASNPEEIYYIHCRGGKDRTGYAIMIIMALLNVPVEYLVYDYTLTNLARKEKNIRYWNQFYQQTENISTANTLYNLYIADGDYILASINEIIQNHGGFENYAIKELGITQDDIMNLKANLLY